MTAELAHRGLACNHKKVEAMMRRHGIVARRHRRRRGLTTPDQAAPPIPDLVGRLFDPDRLDHTWVGDVERHEALLDRAAMKGRRRWALAGVW